MVTKFDYKITYNQSVIAMSNIFQFNCVLRELEALEMGDFGVPQKAAFNRLFLSFSK